MTGTDGRRTLKTAKALELIDSTDGAGVGDQTVSAGESPWIRPILGRLEFLDEKLRDFLHAELLD